MSQIKSIGNIIGQTIWESWEHLYKLSEIKQATDDEFEATFKRKKDLPHFNKQQLKKTIYFPIEVYHDFKVDVPIEIALGKIVVQIFASDVNIYCKHNGSMPVRFLLKHLYNREVYDSTRDFKSQLYHFDAKWFEEPLELWEYFIAFKNLNTVLLTHHFDKLTGEFVDSKKTNSDQGFTKILRNTNVKNRNENCCVCFERTRSKTKCGHPLCYVCWDKIKLKDEHGEEEGSDDDGDEEYRKPCPLCRQCIEGRDR